MAVSRPRRFSTEETVIFRGDGAGGVGADKTHLVKTRLGSDSLFLRRKASPPRASSFSSSRLYSFALACHTKSSVTRPSHLSYLKSE